MRDACACGWTIPRSRSPTRAPPTAKPRSRSAPRRSPSKPDPAARLQEPWPARSPRQLTSARTWNIRSTLQQERCSPPVPRSSGRWPRATRWRSFSRREVLSSSKAEMRRFILLAFFTAAACTSAPKPAVKSAAGLPPLGPCPVSSWKPEAPPPTASAKTSMVLLTVGEWARFGKQIITYSADAAPRTEQLGVKEREAPQRIQDYWASVGHPERSGLDDVPWSAAFISWDIQSAGVPRDLFCPSQTHTIYVERLVLRERQPGGAFNPHRPDERQ